MIVQIYACLFVCNARYVKAAEGRKWFLKFTLAFLFAMLDTIKRLKEENDSLNSRLAALESKMAKMEKRWHRHSEDIEDHRIKISKNKNKITILKGELLQDVLILSDRLKAVSAKKQIHWEKRRERIKGENSFLSLCLFLKNVKIKWILKIRRLFVAVVK